MACVRKRRGVWVVDAYVHGRREVKTYRTRRDAEDALAKIHAATRQRMRPAVDACVTLADYVPRFLADCADQEVARLTLERYRSQLDNHILPALGATRLRDLTHADVRTLLLSKREEGAGVQGQRGPDRVGKAALSKNTVKQLRSVLSSVLALAVQDDVVGANVALGLLQSRRTKKSRQRSRARVGEAVKAMDRDQCNLFLSVASENELEVFPALAIMALSGLRIGEA
jgi:integrase